MHRHEPHDIHDHFSARDDKVFGTSVALNLGLVAVQVGFGIYAHSLALVADAGHNLGDVLGLILGWMGSFLSRRRPGGRRTFGLRRSSILATLLNGLLLILVSGALGWEALQRFRDPQPVQGGVVMLVAAIAVAVNVGSALLFLRGSSRDLNLRGAYLHLMGDAAVSVAVVISGAIIWATGWNWIDPLASLLVMAAILYATYNLLTESLDLLLDAVPSGVDLEAVRLWLRERPGVTGVHDLHVWAVSTTETALTAHLVMADGHPGDRFLRDLALELHSRFDIEHPTIQIEVGDGTDCIFEPDTAL